MSGTADAGVGGAVHRESSTNSDPGVQDEPVLDMHDATIQQKLEGIAAQTRVDLADAPVERYEEVISQRLSDSGIDVPDDEVAALARRARGAGSEGSGGSGV